jgi:uncharacterized protein involved in exopolysaccharide biosynthesis
MQKEHQTIDMREVLITLFKHRYRILAIFLSIVIAVTVISFSMRPVYEARSSLMVKFGREYIYNPAIGDTKISTSFQSFPKEEAIRSEIQILTSDDLVKKVIESLGLENIYPDLIKKDSVKISPLEAAITRFSKYFSVKNIKKSNVIEISFQHENPEIAASAVNQLVELFKEKHLQVLSSPKSSFLEKQLIIYREKLKASEDDLEDFKQKYKIFSIDEQISLLLKQRMDLDTSLKTAQNRTHELEQALTYPPADGPIVFKNAPYYTETERYKVIDDAKAKLLSLQLKEQELLGKYKEGSRMIVNVRKEIELVRTFLVEQEENLAKAEMNALKAKSSTINNQMKQLDGEIEKLTFRVKQFQNLQRELDTHERNYTAYVNKLEEARISEDMDRQKIANIGVIQEAIRPAEPVKPNKSLNIALGIFLGAIAGIGYAFFSEYNSQCFTTPESIERRLDIPVLTTIPYKKV